MILQNLHTHSTFCDGKNTPEEMVLGAIDAGCGSLGFSGHSPLPPACDPDGWTMRPGDVAAYRAEVLRLREKYAGQLAIFLGLEQDLDSPLPTDGYDYLIGSVHSLWAGGVSVSVDHRAEITAAAIREHFGGDPMAYAEAYYRRVAEVPQRTGCQILGHLDLLTKFNQQVPLFDESHPRYAAAAMEAVEAALRADCIFEINTGAMSRGYRTAPYPAPFLLRAIRERCGRICITSDSHSAGTITHGFHEAAELAKACGFRESWVLTERGFAAQAL